MKGMPPILFVIFLVVLLMMGHQLYTLLYRLHLDETNREPPELDTNMLSTNQFFSGDEKIVLGEKRDKAVSDNNDYYLSHQSHTKHHPWLWEQSTKIPQWMKIYFEWHQNQRSSWNATNSKPYRYLVMSCRQDEQCGGTADRLRPAVAMLRLAANTSRLLLIHWNRPAKLEEFLLPPTGGMDWRVPEWLLPELQLSNIAAEGNHRGILRSAQGSNRVVRTKYQSPSYGANYYDETIEDTNEHSMNDVFSEVWRVLFTPAPPIAHRIKQELTRLHLIPGSYSSIHVRTYQIEPENINRAMTNASRISATHVLHREVKNAVRCGTSFGGKLFFASDSMDATYVAIDYARSNSVNMTSRVVSTQSETKDKSHDASRGQGTAPPSILHLGFAENLHASAFYSVFVDLYLLALGKCVIYGGGGFGQWSYLLSARGDSNICGFKHGKRATKCSTIAQTGSFFEKSTNQGNFPFLPPMTP